MGAHANLEFQQESVEFGLTMQMVLPEHGTATAELPVDAPHEILTRSWAVEEMAKLLDADVDLGSSNFQAEVVLSIPLNVSERPTEMCLKEHTICIAADDDSIMRMGYKMLYKKLRNLDISNSTILGATFDEACTIAHRVLRLAGQYGEGHILVILDQNLDSYPDDGASWW